MSQIGSLDLDLGGVNEAETWLNSIGKKMYKTGALNSNCCLDVKTMHNWIDTRIQEVYERSESVTDH